VDAVDQPSRRTPGRASAFAPATVSNVGCGFDVLGFALEGLGDVVVAAAGERPGVEVLDIEGDGGRLPREPDRNTAAIAAAALLESCSVQGAAGPFHHVRGPISAPGVGLRIRKGMPLASGLGSSGASAVAAVVAVNELLGLGASSDLLLRCAMAGERASAGAPHPDNVAPALFGGFVLARSIDPPDVVRLPVPEGLACAILHPALEVETRAARALLPEQVPLRDAVRQWANVGALVAALHAGDLDLLGRSMVDHIVERHRAHLVPGFHGIIDAAREAGAIGASLSGAGPAMFALCRSVESARRVADAMRTALRAHGGVEGDAFVSRVARQGARVVPEPPGPGA
jgi:homoserine kinase